MQRPHVRKVAKWALAVATVAVLVVWLLSGRWTVTLWFSGERWIGIQSGRLSFMAKTPEPVPEDAVPPGVYFSRNLEYERFGLRWSFRFVNASYFQAVIVPLWSIALPLMGGTVLGWRPELRAARRRGRGACIVCGYDRCGLSDEAKCPECGREPSAFSGEQSG